MDNLLSARKPVWLAAAAKRKHSLHVSNNICFSSPLDKQNGTGFFIKNSHLPFPIFFGSLLIYSVSISHCDLDVLDLLPLPHSTNLPGELFFPIHHMQLPLQGPPRLQAPILKDEHTHRHC